MGEALGQLAVVVGATGSIGGAVTRGLTKRGVRVLAVARTASSLDALAATSELVTPCAADTPRLRRIAATVARERGVPFDQVWREYEAASSLGRLPTADEIAWAVMLLLEPEADVLHGGVLHLDAGGLREAH